MLQAYRLGPAGTAATDSVLLRLQDGTPWAVRGTRAQGGRFIVLASPLTVQATTIPASAAMIPLLDRVTGTWAAADAARAEAQPGERVALPQDAEEVIDPAGARVRVQAGEAFDGATQPGVYRVVARGKVIGAFVVNPAAVESDLSYADAGRVQRALAPLDVKRMRAAHDWRRGVFAHRVGREVWRVFLVILLVLLIVEAVAAATGRTAHATEPAAAEL